MNRAEAEIPKPRSACRVLLAAFAAGFALLIVTAVLLSVWGQTRVTPLERKLLGRWKSVAGGTTRYYHFYSGGIAHSGDAPNRPLTDVWLWRAREDEFEVRNVSDDWIPDWANELLGRTNWDQYRISFDDEDTFDLYVGTPDGELIFYRIK